MRVLHVITGLNLGGAESMLAKLVERDAGGPELAPTVLSLLPPGRVAARIERAGVEVLTLGMRQGLPGPAALARLARLVRTRRPRLIQGWMHHGNLAASAAAALSPDRPPVLWNVRHSLVDLALEKPLSRAVLRLGRRLSAGPAAIIYNSAVAAAQYAAFGFAAGRAMVIPNGFDCERFRPDAGARDRLRSRFGIAPGPLVVAMVARRHPMKDPATLAEAVRRARAGGRDLHLLIAGEGTDAPAPAVAAALARLPANRVTLAGVRDDVADWLPGVDIVALPSAWGEGFPNILGEAMACGVPCVATDVGDSAAIIGAEGGVVPPRDPAAFAAALGTLADIGAEGRARLGAAARARVLANWELGRIAARYAALHRTALGSRAAAAAPARLAEAA